MEEYSQLDDQTQVNQWIRFGLRLGVTAALHPIEYSKVLIQLGYEPIKPRPGKTIFLQPALVLPNIFQYANYIKRVDGFYGLYRGVAPKILGIVISNVGSEKIAQKLGYSETDDDDKDDTELTDQEYYNKFQRQLKREIILHASGIIISHPFQVISIRMMAQFIGRETAYKSVWSSIKEIWVNEGIFGFFSGVTPKLICDLSCLVLASTTTYYVAKHYVRERANQNYVSGFIQFVYATLLYPLNVITTCMTVTGSRLKAGQPPQMLIYNNWIDCWSDLSVKGELKRGSSLFGRYYRPTHSIYKMHPPILPKLAKY